MRAWRPDPQIGLRYRTRHETGYFFKPLHILNIAAAYVQFVYIYNIYICVCDWKLPFINFFLLVGMISFL